MTIEGGTVALRDAASACPACGCSDMESFYAAWDIPAHSCVLVPTREEALEAPTGDLELAFCHACGFITNTRFDPSLLDYSQDYEETQGFSPRFNEFARDLAQRLIERHALRGEHVVEVGCGSKGEFLALLCELGENRGIGIDPSFRPERSDAAVLESMAVVREHLDDRHVDLETDLICCRHTLEHIHDVGPFVDLTRRIAANRVGTPVFYEVPDVRRVLTEGAFWDIYHEHCSYFSLGSLARLFRSRGLRPTSLETGFGHQYLLIDAEVADADLGGPLPLEEPVEALWADAERFRRGASEGIQAWQEDLAGLHGQGRRVVLWGSGSKGVAFLTTLGISDEVAAVVDINPFKHGMFMAGSGHEIVSPPSLALDRPDVVVIMNPIYRREIERQLDDLGVSAEIRTLEPVGSDVSSAGRT